MAYIISILLMILVIGLMVLNNWIPNAYGVQEREDISSQITLSQSMELLYLNDDSVNIIRDVITPAILLSSSPSSTIVTPKKRKITDESLRKSSIIKANAYINVRPPTTL